MLGLGLVCASCSRGEHVTGALATLQLHRVCVLKEAGTMHDSGMEVCSATTGCYVACYAAVLWIDGEVGRPSSQAAA
jgi:hypothetical protein